MLSPLLWRLDEATARFTDIFPDVAVRAPRDVATVADLQRAQRFLLNRQLHPDGARRSPAPLSTDFRALANAYPMRAGAAPLPSRFVIPRWRRWHTDTCPRCTATKASDHGDPACEGQRIIDVLERGWAMQWDGPPPPAPAPRRAQDAATQAELWRRTVELERKGRIRAIGFSASAARPFFVAKSRFSAAAMTSAAPWLLDAGTDVPVFQPTPKLRMVFDYRRSRANTVSRPWPIRLPTVATAALLCRPGWYCNTADLESGYTQVPLDGGSWRDPTSTISRLAFTVLDPEGVRRYFGPLRLMFGSNSAGSCFCAMSALLLDILTAVLRARGHKGSLTCYIDDWILTAPTAEEADAMLRDFLWACEQLGVTVNRDKCTKRATQRVHWLGVDIDTVRQCVALPAQRVAQIRAEATALLRLAPSCPVSRLKSFAGLITWASSVVTGSRAFTAATAAAAQRRSPAIKLPDLVRDDLEFWAAEGTWRGYVEGVPILQQESMSVCSFLSDAGGAALGAHTAQRLAWRAFSESEQRLSSTTRELLAIECGLQHLCGHKRDSIVVVGCDNVAAVIAANSGRCGSAKADSIPVIRRMGRWLAERRLQLAAVWVERSHNTLADAIADASSLTDARAVFDAARRSFDTIRQATKHTARAAH